MFAKMIYYALHAYTMAYNSYSVVFMAVISNINLEPLRKQGMSSCVGESPWGGSSRQAAAPSGSRPWVGGMVSQTQTR